MIVATITLIAELILALCRLDSGSYAPQLGPVPEIRALHLAQALADAAALHDVDPLLLTALAYRESSFDSAAVSPVGAFGLMQLNPRYWGRTALYACLSRPNECDRWNAYYGAQSLKHYIDRCKSEASALRAYRTGSCGRAGPQTQKVLVLRALLRRAQTVRESAPLKVAVSL